MSKPVLDERLSDDHTDPVWEVLWRVESIREDVYDPPQSFLTQAITVDAANKRWRKVYGRDAIHISTKPYAGPLTTATVEETRLVGKIEDTTETQDLARRLLNSQTFLKQRDEMLVYPEASDVISSDDGHEASFMLTDREGFEYTVTVERTGKKRKPLPSVPGTVISWVEEEGGIPQIARLSNNRAGSELWVLYPKTAGTENRLVTPPALQRIIGDAEWTIVGVAK